MPSGVGFTIEEIAHIWIDIWRQQITSPCAYCFPQSEVVMIAVKRYSRASKVASSYFDVENKLIASL